MFLFRGWLYILPKPIRKILNEINDKRKIAASGRDKYEALDRVLMRTSYLYFLIPLYILLLFWLKWYVSIPLMLALGVATYYASKTFEAKTTGEYAKLFNCKKWIALGSIIIIINILSGAGGFFFQNWDYRTRNAILHDLINFDWPVKYAYSNAADIDLLGSKGIFSYYFAFWLPGALVGKAFGFSIASAFMLLWQTAGVFIFFYLVSRHLGGVKMRYIIILLLFSGLDIFGKYIMVDVLHMSPPPIYEVAGRIDIWTPDFGYSSFITQLFWVFNQSLPAWIATILLVSQVHYKNYGYIASILLPFAPLPLLGLFYLMLIFIAFGINFSGLVSLSRIKELMSKQSVLAFIAIIPVILLFLTNPNGQAKGIVFARNGFSIDIVWEYLLFIAIEVGYFVLLFNMKNYKLLLSALVFLAILPVFYVGMSRDLCNRASIPLLVILYLLVIRAYDRFRPNKGGLRMIIFSVLLLFASVTNINEIQRSICLTRANDIIGQKNINDTWLTFSSVNVESQYYAKYYVSKYDQSEWLFKYIIR